MAACSGGSGHVAPSTRSPNGPGRTVRYGDGKAQVADLWLPSPRSAEPVGVVVLSTGASGGPSTTAR